MKNTPIDYTTVENIIHKSKLLNVGQSSIRQLLRLVNDIEKETGEKFVRMEMGVPGIKAPKIAIEAEKNALDSNCAAVYPPFDGIPELKTEISKFVKNFLNVEVSSKACIPTAGSGMGAYIAFMVAGRKVAQNDTVLFIDPGFPVHKQQAKMLGLQTESFDVYEFRGEKLKPKLEEYLSKKNISLILYSNPNNPSWICFTNEELKIIGELANKYDVVIAEDLAYFAMDFRKDLSKPALAPYQASVANYTNNYMLMISTSKTFSYAGQRIGLLVVSDALFNRDFDELKRFYPSSNFGNCITNGTIYTTTGGCSHSAQYGILALLKAANQKNYSITEDVLEYGRRAVKMKQIFKNNGFHLVYDRDIKQPLADGFDFTISYNGFSGDDLIKELLYYGLSAISLSNTGSARTEGIRISVSQVDFSQFPILNERLKMFHQNNKLNT